ncbi:Prefoldin beta-like protein [Gorgonomyces haynaldii]|nr:Prefoldin beta-like protein [Gorgonomyces haynaldii]
MAQVAQLKQELNQLAQKIGELEQERDEHTLVIDTLDKCDPKRPCYRMIGGVLVEQTVEKVKPQVEENRQGIMAVMRQLGQAYAEKEQKVREAK